MRTELSGQEKNIVRVKVEFEAQEFTSNLDRTIREISQKVNIPGFRKGHIPRKMVEMRLGKEALYEEALEKLMPDAIRQAVEDYDLNLIATPSFNAGTIKEGEPLTVELTFEVLPEVRLPEFGDIEIERLRTVVTDEMIEHTARSLKKNLSTLKPVVRPAAEGDVVSISVAVESGEPQKENIDLGEPTLMPKAKEAFLGKSLGDELLLDLTPENQPEEQETQAPDPQAPKTYLYNVTVDEIKERIWPEMAPEFYKQALGLELDSEEAFIEELKKRLHGRLEQENFDQACSAAVLEVVARSELEVPDLLVRRQIDYQKKLDDTNSQQRAGVGIEEFLRRSSISPDQYEQQVREKAMEIVRRTLVLDEIGDKFDVAVDKEEIEAEINGRAAAFQVEPERMKTFYSKNKDGLAQVADDLRYGKIARLILEKVTVKEVDELSTSEGAA